MSWFYKCIAMTKTVFSWLSQPEVQNARLTIPVSVGILTGIWNNPVNIQQITEQVKVVREQNFNGVSFFTGKVCGVI